MQDCALTPRNYVYFFAHASMHWRSKQICTPTKADAHHVRLILPGETTVPPVHTLSQRFLASWAVNAFVHYKSFINIPDYCA